MNLSADLYRIILLEFGWNIIWIIVLSNQIVHGQGLKITTGTTLKMTGTTINMIVDDGGIDEFPEYKFDTTHQFGLIVQEVVKIIPEFVKTDDKGYKAVQYDRITAILVQATKEQ